MNRRLWIAGGLAVLLAFSLVFTAWATDAQLFFSRDKSGQDRVTSVNEGDSIWIVVNDPDQDTDCDARDKIWTDVKVMDAKTGAHIVWKSYLNADGDAAGKKHGVPGYTPYGGHYPGKSAGWLGGDFLEESGPSTGLFVSSRPFQIGARVRYDSDGRNGTHITGPYIPAAKGVDPLDFEWGGYLYAGAHNTPNEKGDDRIWVNAEQSFVLADQPGAYFPSGTAYLPPGSTGGTDPEKDYILGRFEQMDTIVGLYVDPADPKDVALTQAKIVDTRATIRWDKEVYPNANKTARVVVTDPDENVNCSAVEYVPVFILVNPGSWNPVSANGSPPDPKNATDFCALKRFGGVKDSAGDVGPGPIVWYNIYDSGLKRSDFPTLRTGQPLADGTYFIQYPKNGLHTNNVTTFDTASNSGITRVMFYAKETGSNSGVFQLDLNNLLDDLGFNTLNVRDVLAAYYIDPNDQDDFTLGTAYIEERNTSVVRFTDSARKDVTEYWIGRDPVYVEVVDANANVEACCPEKVVVQVCDPHEIDDTEWLVLDEASSNSSLFLTNVGMRLRPVWDSLGISDTGGNGGYQLELDNWKLESFTEDVVYVRYNDVAYAEETLVGLGDRNTTTSFPPLIEEARVANDVSFDLMSIGDTQVYDGTNTSMYFRDRQGNRVSGYVNSDCVFIEVVDGDQDQDLSRRERIDGYWDGGQGLPFGPFALNRFDCSYRRDFTHPVNALLGDTNVFNDGGHPVIYVLNPRNGRWAAVDLMETGVGTGDFVSVVCIDLVSQYGCVPSLGVLPGDTIIAAYQDPSNHSDIAWIATKVSIGGGGTSGQASTVAFASASGDAVTSYTDADNVYVKVVDPSHSGATSLLSAVTIGTTTYDLAPLAGAATDTFITPAITMESIGAHAGSTITATYTDPADPADNSSATVSVASVLHVDSFLVKPNPFGVEAVFTFSGFGVPATFSVTVYSVSGHKLWSRTEINKAEVRWDGRDEEGVALAGGPYVFVAVLTGNDGTLPPFKGTVLVDR